MKDIACFMRFYGYSLKQTLDEYAKSFNALVIEMYSIQAQEIIDSSYSQALANGDENVKDVILRQLKGLKSIVKEVRTIKNVKR
jgi:hypothetical protein